MAPHRSSKGRADPDEAEPATPAAIVVSSDDEEANRDLSLEIVARAQRRKARGAGLASASTVDAEPVVVVETPLGDTDGAAPPEGKKKKRKKEKAMTPAVDTAAEKEQSQMDAVDGLKVKETIGSDDSVLTQANGAGANSVLRKLVRGPRYFDPVESVSMTCYNCGEEGHFAANCPMEKRQKPCFLCGLFGHNAKQCNQGQDCFICKRRGHFAKDCPDKYNRNSQNYAVCLRCGDRGHDMSVCTNDYSPDDLKETTCYICKQQGHICCAEISENSSVDVSCYNCAQPGHSGSGCAKQRGESSNMATPTLCYKCGEEGHFARGCTKNAKRSTGESSAPVRKKVKKRREFDSEPRNTGRAAKQKTLVTEKKTTASIKKSRIRGGWIVDDDGNNLYDTPCKKHHRNSGCTPVRSSDRWSGNSHYRADGDYSTPRRSKQKSDWSSPSFIKAHKFGHSVTRFRDGHSSMGHCDKRARHGWDHEW